MNPRACQGQQIRRDHDAEPRPVKPGAFARCTCGATLNCRLDWQLHVGPDGKCIVIRTARDEFNVLFG